ncbi:MAG: metallophosphoesterase [Candidatus Methanomethylicaceae archaeon]|jgi:Icc-related predicted phosphoesterase
MPLKLLCLTDIHGKISSLSAILGKVLGDQKVDLITISGDISHFGQGEDIEQALNVIDKTGVPYCYVLGNCDPIELRDGVRAEGICLEATCMSYMGITLIGCGGATPTPFGTPFEISDDEMVNIITKSRAECYGENSANALMLVVHNPPKGEIVDRTRTGLHVGSAKLRDLILKTSPLLVQCGHIHEAAGVEHVGRTVVFNPGPAFRGSYALVEVDNLRGGVCVALGTI